MTALIIHLLSEYTPIPVLTLYILSTGLLRYVDGVPCRSAHFHTYTIRNAARYMNGVPPKHVSIVSPSAMGCWPYDFSLTGASQTWRSNVFVCEIYLGSSLAWLSSLHSIDQLPAADLRACLAARITGAGAAMNKETDCEACKVHLKFCNPHSTLRCS